MGCGMYGGSFRRNIHTCEFVDLDGFGKAPVIGTFLQRYTTSLAAATYAAGAVLQMFNNQAAVALVANQTLIDNTLIINPVEGCQVFFHTGVQFVSHQGFLIGGANDETPLINAQLQTYVNAQQGVGTGQNRRATPIYQGDLQDHIACVPCAVLPVAFPTAAAISGSVVRTFEGDTPGASNYGFDGFVQKYNYAVTDSLTLGATALVLGETLQIQVYHYGLILGTDGRNCNIFGRVGAPTTPTCDDISAKPDANLQVLAS